MIVTLPYVSVAVQSESTVTLPGSAAAGQSPPMSPSHAETITIHSTLCIFHQFQHDFTSNQKNSNKCQVPNKRRVTNKCWDSEAHVLINAESIY